MAGRLTNKQQAFLNAYLKHFNATRAAKEAGYSEDSAQQIGSENLSKPLIADAIRARMESDAMAASEVLYHLAQIARGDMDDMLDANGNLDMEKARQSGKTNLIKRVKNRVFATENHEITEMETEGYDRLKALELLGKHHKLFTDKQEVTGEDGKPIPLIITKMNMDDL